MTYVNISTTLIATEYVEITATTSVPVLSSGEENAAERPLNARCQEKNAGSALNSRGQMIDNAGKSREQRNAFRACLLRE